MDEAEALLMESLAIVEPTMYRVFVDQVRESLDALGARAATSAKP
jgi:hypothetical protein